MTPNSRTSPDSVGIEHEFRQAMASSGIVTHDTIIADGRINRIHVEGDRQGSRNGWYVLFPDPYPVGRYGSWKTQVRGSWSAPIPKKFTRKESEELKKRRDEAVASQRAEIERRESKARSEAEAIWRNAEPTPAGHPYLLSKKISPNEIKLYKGCLVVPVYDVGGTLQSLQRISPSGEKRFLPGGRITGCCYPMGKLGKRAFVCEGFATGASIYEATGDCIFIAFHAGNLLAVARAIRKKWARIELIIAADNDQWSDGNPGLSKATKAAKETGAKVALPRFRNTETSPTDFNDLFRVEGVAAVREQLRRTFAPISVPELRELKVIPLSDIKAKQQEYLWQDYLPDNQLIAIYGPSHTAKSPLALDLAARITSGLAWPDGSPNTLGPRKVLLLSAGEDAVETVLKPRFVLAGGDPSKVDIIVGSIPKVAEGETPGPIDEEMLALDRDIGLIEARLEADREIALVIVDPVTNHLGSRKTNVEEEVRPVLMRLKRMSEHLCVPVIIIGHLNRREKGTAALDRMLGARAFSGVPRTIYMTGRDSDVDGAEKHSFVIAQERGLGATGWRYHTEKLSAVVDGQNVKEVKVIWDAQDEKLTGQDAVDSLTKLEKSREQEAAEALVEFLQQRGGSAAGEDCTQYLRSYGGINFTRVRKRAGVEKIQPNKGKFGKAFWRLVSVGQSNASLCESGSVQRPKNNTVNYLSTDTYPVGQPPLDKPLDTGVTRVVQRDLSSGKEGFPGSTAAGSGNATNSAAAEAVTQTTPPARKPYRPGISPFTNKPYPPAYSTYRPGGKQQ